MQRLYVHGIAFSERMDGRIRSAMRSPYRTSPRVRELVRLRSLCVAGRAAPLDGLTSDAVTWVLSAAPLWILARVCVLLVGDGARAQCAM